MNEGKGSRKWGRIEGQSSLKKSIFPPAKARGRRNEWKNRLYLRPKVEGKKAEKRQKFCPNMQNLQKYAEKGRF